MKEAIVSKGPEVEIVDSPIPLPGINEVVIKVVVSGSNPKDWKRAEMGITLNTGDDIAGVVHAVGSDVVEFKPGDRVAAFHEMMAPHGSFAEYAISDAATTFHLPKKTSFEEGATLPLAAMTAAYGLYQSLHLPLPWQATSTPIPLIIYGGASAVGSFAIQLATLSNIHPLICIAGKGIPHVESLIDPSKGDLVLDYRVGNEQLVKNLSAAVHDKAPGGKVAHAFDCISEHHSFQNICEVLDRKAGHITLILPNGDYKEIPPSITKTITYVGGAHRGTDRFPYQEKSGARLGNQEFAYVMFRFFTRGLQQGWLKPMPYEVLPGGLGGVEEGLKRLKEGRVSAQKLVFRIEETEGAERYRTN